MKIYKGETQRGYGKCAKQHVVALLINKGKVFVGTNICKNPQEKCPREDLPTGEGYELCKDICNQVTHAEKDVCELAGKYCKGADVYLFGYYYACSDCIKFMEKKGIANLYILG